MRNKGLNAHLFTVAVCAGGECEGADCDHVANRRSRPFSGSYIGAEIEAVAVFKDWRASGVIREGAVAGGLTGIAG
jgi:hypothetical protein